MPLSPTGAAAGAFIPTRGAGFGGSAVQAMSRPANANTVAACNPSRAGLMCFIGLSLSITASLCRTTRDSLIRVATTVTLVNRCSSSLLGPPLSLVVDPIRESNRATPRSAVEGPRKYLQDRDGRPHPKMVPTRVPSSTLATATAG